VDWDRAVVFYSTSLPGWEEGQGRTTPITITDVVSAVCNTFKCLPSSELTQSIP